METWKPYLRECDCSDYLLTVRCFTVPSKHTSVIAAICPLHIEIAQNIVVITAANDHMIHTQTSYDNLVIQLIGRHLNNGQWKIANLMPFLGNWLLNSTYIQRELGRSNKILQFPTIWFHASMEEANMDELVIAGHGLLCVITKTGNVHYIWQKGTQMHLYIRIYYATVYKISISCIQHSPCQTNA